MRIIRLDGLLVSHIGGGIRQGIMFPLIGLPKNLYSSAVAMCSDVVVQNGGVFLESHERGQY